MAHALLILVHDLLLVHFDVLLQALSVFFQVRNVLLEQLGPLLLLQVLGSLLLDEVTLCLELGLLPILAVSYDAHFMFFDDLIVLSKLLVLLVDFFHKLVCLQPVSVLFLAIFFSQVFLFLQHIDILLLLLNLVGKLFDLLALVFEVVHQF